MSATSRTGNVHPTAIIGGDPEYLDPPDPPYLEPLIDPTVRINSFVTVDAGCHDGPRTSVGAGTIVMTKSHVGHNAVIGANVMVGTGVILGGYSSVGDDARLGVGAIVLPHRKVGGGAVIGSGAVVTKDVPPNEVWAGNPAKFIRRVEEPTIPYTQRGSL